MDLPLARLRATDCSYADLEARLCPSEREVLAGWQAEKRRQDWLLGRAAAKQAVREALAREGLPAPEWRGLEVLSSGSGAPLVRFLAQGAAPMAVTLSHGHGEAAAAACRPGAEGGLPGVDLELVRPRRLGTLRFYLHPQERERVLALPGSDEDPPPAGAAPSPRDVLAIVLWALKEAAFKALQPPRGTGLLDVEVELEAPHDAPRGTARVAYRGQARERAADLGVGGVDAGWAREGDLVLAWVLARGGRLPG